MKRYGLIGFPLSHSFSKNYFVEKFSKSEITDSSYENFELNSIDEFEELIKHNPDIMGLSVTIPYKEKIIPFLTELSSDAKAIGAVNTIQINNSETGGLIGHNTDVVGFKVSLLKLIGNSYPEALVLGTGGASKAVVFVLEKMGINYKLVSRQKSALMNCISYNQLNEELIVNAKLIINTTPLGMFPNINSKPGIPYDAIGSKHFLFDLTYNPSITAFLKIGLDKGAAIKNGQEMLELQADAAWNIWNSE